MISIGNLTKGLSSVRSFRFDRPVCTCSVRRYCHERSTFVCFLASVECRFDEGHNRHTHFSHKPESSAFNEHSLRENRHTVCSDGSYRTWPFKIQDYFMSYLIREIKYAAKYIPHHSRPQHILHILKLKQQTTKQQQQQQNTGNIKGTY